MSAPHLIFTADDFGRCEAINRAVLIAHTQGVLTSASLMASGRAFEQAVEIARQTPTLAVGLHIVVVDGESVLPAIEIPHLVNESGEFLRDPFRAGLRYFFDRRAKKELAKELRAQFERFASTGLPLSHVDGHLHMHLHPTVLEMVLPLAREFGAKGFRLPRDDLARALRYSSRQASAKITRSLAMSVLSARAVNKLQESRLNFAGCAFGLVQSGHMHEDYVMRMLAGISTGSVEFFFHPTDGPRLDALGPNPDDLKTLLSPKIRHFINSHGYALTSYPLLNSLAAE